MDACNYMGGIQGILAVELTGQLDENGGPLPSPGVATPSLEP